MTKFNPKIPDESVNYSKEHPLKDYFFLVIGFLAVLGIGFICLDFLVGTLVNRISLEQEVSWLGSVSTKSLTQKLGESKEASVEEVKLLELMQNLWLPFNKGESLKFSVAVEKEKLPNAFTGFGGNFTFTSGLLKEMKSLNALAFVACHELGHFYHRHVLRGSGRRVVMTLFFKLIGLGGVTESFIGAGSEAISLKFSRNDERSADSFALDCQQKYFGHVAGFDEFFLSTQKREINSLAFFSTHPLSRKRIEEMKIQAIEKGYSLEGELTPLEFVVEALKN